MNIKWNIFLRMIEICKERRFNSEIFNARASPPKWCSKWWKEIREEYIRMLSSFFSGRPSFIFEDNGNNKEYPKEKIEKTARNIELEFEGIFRNFLQDIENKYPEGVWEIEKCSENKK